MELARLVASPLAKGHGGRRYLDEEIEAMCELGLAVQGKGTRWERLDPANVVGRDQSTALALRAYARLERERRLTRLLVEHFRRQSLVSWHGSRIPDLDSLREGFSNFAFSAWGYSWLAPLVRSNQSGKPGPTPVMIDVFARTCTPSDVTSFLTRVQGVIGRSKNKFRVLGIIAAPDFSDSAWSEARNSSFMVINLRQLYGDFALETLCEFESLFKGITGNATLVEDHEVEHLAASLASLKTNPLFHELRGLTIEVLVGLALRSRGYENVRLALDVPFAGQQTRDVDVLGSKNSYAEWRVVECKAQGSSTRLDPSEVNKFYTETVPAFITWANKKHGAVQKCSAEIWTTGRINDDCRDALAALKLNRVIIPRLLHGQSVRDELPRDIKQRCMRLLDVVANGLTQ